MERFFYNIWYKKGFSFFSLLLLPLTAIYYICWKINAFFYNKFNIARCLDCPVISVGNITLGGTGKTPFILYLLELYKEKRVVVLTRGYKGKIEGVVEDKEGFSDEARLIKKRFPEVVVLAGKNRYSNYLKYRENHQTPDLVILDDGFQHRKIKRNLDIVMFDGKLLLGNGLLFPSGPLREPLYTVKNFANLIIVKDGDSDAKLLLKRLLPEKTVINFVSYAYNLITLDGNEVQKEKLMQNKTVAFCGIGNPDSFRNGLKKINIVPESFISFGDHIDYTSSAIDRIISVAADYYITTEKDAVKLTKLWKDKDKLVILLPEYRLEEDVKELYIV